MNGLEALDKLKHEDYCNCSLSADNKFFCMGGRLQESEELNTIEQELKEAKENKAKAEAFDVLIKKFNITLGDWNEHIKGIFIEETIENHRARDINVCSDMLSDYEEDVFKKAGL